MGPTQWLCSVACGRRRYLLLLACASFLWQVRYVTRKIIPQTHPNWLLGNGTIMAMLETSCNGERQIRDCSEIHSLTNDTRDCLVDKNRTIYRPRRQQRFHDGLCPDQSQWIGSSGVFNISEDKTIYFNLDDCFIEGTLHSENKSCFCRPKWHGPHCSIPNSVWFSDLPKNIIQNLTPRFTKYRHIIQAFPFNIEFDMLDARFSELADVVDVFLILESNYTAYGKPRSLHLLNSLRQGYYKTVSCKIVHVLLDYFPDAARSNGWIADSLHRNYISQQGLTKQVRGYKEGDLFVLTDADELPSRESLLFLKLHDGFPEPVYLQYRSRIYGFFWGNTKKQFLSLSAVVSVGILRRVLNNKCITIRSGPPAILKAKSELNSYLKTHNTTSIKKWTIGHGTDAAGWHCSWCFNPEGILNKLTSAQNGDFPRWGDYPDKTNTTYILKLMKIGLWFDDKNKFTKIPYLNSSQYAPMYFIKNYHVYQDLLKNPFLM